MSNKPIRKTLKKILIPFLEAEGYTGKFPDFQRIENDRLHLLSVEFDKWDGGFFVGF